MRMTHTHQSTSSRTLNLIHSKPRSMPQKLERRKKPEAEHQPRHVPQTRPPNSTGLADFPPELLIEITNHLPRFPVPCDHIKFPLQREIPTRQATLLILVQLCRSFRQTLMPFLWEEIILCSVRAGQKHPVDYTWRPHACKAKKKGYCDSCEKPLAYDILVQLKTVGFRNLEYATRVQTLSIFIPRHHRKTILPEFARCLTLLPNLKTLQFHYAPDAHFSQLDEVVQGLFFQYEYRSIQTLVVSGTPGSMALIDVCRNVRHIHFTSFGEIWDHCPSVEKLTGVLKAYFYAYLPEYAPNLKHLQWRTTGDIGSQPLGVIAKLPKLEVVDILLTRPKFKKEAKDMYQKIQAVLDSMVDIPGTHRRAEIHDCAARSSSRA